MMVLPLKFILARGYAASEEKSGSADCHGCDYETVVDIVHKRNFFPHSDYILKSD
jgi:hypothetical protein